MWVDDDVLFNIPLFPSQRTPTKGTIQIQRRDENVPFVGFQGNHKARQSIYNLIFLPDIFIPEESSLEELFKENKRGKTIVSFDFKFLSRDYLEKCHSRFVQLYSCHDNRSPKNFLDTNDSILSLHTSLFFTFFPFQLHHLWNREENAGP